MFCESQFSKEFFQKELKKIILKMFCDYASSQNFFVMQKMPNTAKNSEFAI